MKLKLFGFLGIIVIVFFNNCIPNLGPQFVTINTISNLAVDSPIGLNGNNAVLSHGRLFYSFETASQISAVDSNSTKWDIRLQFNNNNYPIINFNGGSSGPGNAGAYLLTGILDTLLYASNNSIILDSLAKPVVAYSPQNVSLIPGWFNYDQINNFIYPVPNRFLVIRTANRRWVKLEVISFYKNSNSTTQLNLGFISFRYTYQPNGTPVF
ncbi:MAG: HmuY family protein [Sediminibacterium sp.]|nr:HmuY family protein [Sediminibacterium sp.]